MDSSGSFHQLVEAFRSTLEEISGSDLILHVVDASHPDPAGQLATVRQVISEVGAGGLPELVVFNKIDLADDVQRMALRGMVPDSLSVSSKTGEGIAELLHEIARRLPKPDVALTVLVPYDRGDLVSRAHLNSEILKLEYRDEGTCLELLAKPGLAEELAPYRLS